MKWIEVIEVRLVVGNRQFMESQLRQLIEEVKKTGKQTMNVYHRFMLDTDFSIHLFHDSENIEESGSSLGLYLISNFKEFGLVSHRIWIEMAK